MSHRYPWCVPGSLLYLSYLGIIASQANMYPKNTYCDCRTKYDIQFPFFFNSVKKNFLSDVCWKKKKKRFCIYKFKMMKDNLLKY